MSVYKYFQRDVQPWETGCNDQYFTYKCKICGEELQLQMVGSRFIGEPSFEEQNEKLMVRHLEFHELESRLKVVGVEID